MRSLNRAVIAATLAIAPTPAFAALSLVKNCTASDIGLPNGASFTSCAGFYDGNLFNNSSNADLKSGLMNVGAAQNSFSTYAAVPDANKLGELAGVTTINFGKTLYGDTIFGVHYGAGKGSPGNGAGPNGKNLDTSVFYRINAGTAGITSIKLNYAASSNATLFVTNAPTVPEPAVWGMMLIGFGAIGATVRRYRSGASAIIPEEIILRS